MEWGEGDKFASICPGKLILVGIYTLSYLVPSLGLIGLHVSHFSNLSTVQYSVESLESFVLGRLGLAHHGGTQKFLSALLI